MTNKTLQFAMDKAADLPRQAQEEIAREVLERVSTIEHMRAALKVGIDQLDAGLGQPVDIRALLRGARRDHEADN
jgi:hypothetical protein